MLLESGILQNDFLEFVRANYLLKPTQLNSDFIWALSKKSGVTEADVNKLISCIASIKKGMSEQELIKLNKLITKFHQQRIR